MATLTAARLAYKATGVTTDCECVRIVRADGTELRFTNAVEDLTMTDYVDSSGVQQTLASPVVYQSVGFAVTATNTGESMSEPGTVDFNSFVQAGLITGEDLIKGLYNQARVYCFLTDYTNPVEDDEKIITGFWSEAEKRDDEYTITFKSLKDALNTRVGHSISPTCVNKLGDTKCGVPTPADDWVANTAYTTVNSVDRKVGSIVKPLTQTGFYYECISDGTSGGTEPSWGLVVDTTFSDGSTQWKVIYPYEQEGDTVDSSPDRTSFIDSARTEPDDWWKQGKVEFTSGENQGVIVDIKSFDNATNTLTLKQELPYDLTPGDTYKVTVGCSKRRSEDCIAKFKNIYNMLAFPFIPGRTVIFQRGSRASKVD